MELSLSNDNLSSFGKTISDAINQSPNHRAAGIIIRIDLKSKPFL